MLELEDHPLFPQPVLVPHNRGIESLSSKSAVHTSDS